MHYSVIKKCDIANGPGVRVSLFVSGCRNHCKGCFQPETWDFNFGQPFTRETENEIIEALRPAWIQGLTVLGGDPMEPENKEGLLTFLKRLRMELPDKDIWLYTGYLWEDVSNETILNFVDVLVDGPFIEEEKDAGLAFRGSRNQRIIHLNRKGKQMKHFYEKETQCRSEEDRDVVLERGADGKVQELTDTEEADSDAGDNQEKQ